MLARCSLVTLKEESEGKGNKIKVLYDAYVKPTKNVTDYRTKWSGITRERLEKDDVITLRQCRMDVLSFLSSSPDGRTIVLVGHALQNDFDVLNIQHPRELIRDTAKYKPLMRPVRKKFYPRKLSDLSREYLNVHIQNHGVPSLLYEKEDGKCDDDDMNLGHDSIEDAAATLLLYKKFSHDWEQSLGYPLRKLVKVNQVNSNGRNNQSDKNQPSTTLYLDGCNLPIGLRQRHDCNEDEIKYQLLSKANNNAKGKKTETPIDWIPILHSLVSYSSPPSRSKHTIPPIRKVCIFFDGKMYRKSSEKSRPKSFTDLGNGLHLEITNESIEVDDVLVERCIADRENHKIELCKTKRLTTIEQIIEDLKLGLSVDNKTNSYSNNKSFVVVKRKAGGSKTNKKLFDKLCIRRAEEGAFCLIPSLIDNNPRLQNNSIHIAKELERARVDQIVEYEQRECRDVRSIVVTDDVLLSDRIVKEGGVVMRFSQFKHLM